MSKKRKNGEGTWGTKIIKGKVFKFYRDINGKYTYGKTDAAIKKKLSEKNQITQTDKQNITFGEYILEWMKKNKTSIEHTTYNSYEDAIITRLINYKRYDLANVLLYELTDTMFQNYLDALAQDYALSSIKKTWSLIKKSVSYGEIRQDIPILHLKELIKVPSEANVAHKKKEISVPDVQEVEYIYKECKRLDGNNNMWYGNAAYIIILIMYTGMRISEAIALKWSNVDMRGDNYVINIDSSLAKVRSTDKEGNIVYSHYIKTTKSSKSKRSIPLPDRAREAINYFKKFKKNDNDFVCVTSNHTHYQRRNVERSLDRIIKNSGCINKCYTLHSLRHGYGSILLSKGVDIKIVSELLGHEDISFTYNVYIKAFEKDKNDAVKKLN